MGLIILYAMFLNFHSLLISCLIFNILGLVWKWYLFLLCRAHNVEQEKQVTYFTNQCLEVKNDDLFTTSSYFARSHCVWQHLWFMILSETLRSACVCVTLPVFGYIPIEACFRILVSLLVKRVIYWVKNRLKDFMCGYGLYINSAWKIWHI